ncbi:aldehyde dehydrogenase family protein [Rhodococcoides fascians]|uniref:aldehyde dehydrogenase family protein n=1 Tax=Rhodococcoides fascians TaxID=1828 RepID=UPI00050C8A63|nr:aldehyde dehydrogenase family protein [Rhodococcus fascians]
MKRNDVLIGGAWKTAKRTAGVENPATGTVFGRTALGDSDDVDAAVAAAHKSLAAWSTTSPTDRADQIERLVDVLQLRMDDLVEVMVAEVGAPVEMARSVHVELSLDILRSAAAHGRALTDRSFENVNVVHRAAGVAALITPWNYPLYQLAAKVGSALAAGCTVVHKPSELTPLSAYVFAEATIEAGLPPGVFNMVPGTGIEVGAPLAAHPGVDVVSFTGSTAVGRQVAAAAVGHFARITLELGGKSSSIVCDDADLDEAVRATVEACMLNSGQTCSALTRLLVPARMLDDAVRIAADHADAMVLGDPNDPRTQLGPLVSDTQRRRVLGHVAAAVSRGARIVTDTDRTIPAEGYFVRPVVLTDLPPHDPASQEEIFGPVLVVHGVTSDDHAVAVANDTPYGLAGAVWSEDVARAQSIAARLDTGQVFINDAEFTVESPFGGWKHSGFGRELGVEALGEFTELTAIHR